MKPILVSWEDVKGHVPRRVKEFRHLAEKYLNLGDEATYVTYTKWADALENRLDELTNSEVALYMGYFDSTKFYTEIKFRE